MSVGYAATNRSWNSSDVRMCPCFWASSASLKPKLRRREALVGRAVVAGVGEGAVADLVEHLEELLDALLVQRGAARVGEEVGRHRVGHQLGVAGLLRLTLERRTESSK